MPTGRPSDSALFSLPTTMGEWMRCSSLQRDAVLDRMRHVEAGRIGGGSKG
jgi:hypothetical protein